METIKRDLLRLLFLGFILPILGSGASIFWLYRWHFDNYVVHAVLEIVGCLSAIVLVWFLLVNENVRKNFKISEIAISCSAILAMGILDGFHAFSKVGNNFVWLHSLATFVGGVIFCCIWLCLGNRKLSERIILLAFLLAVFLGILAFVFPDLMPNMIGEAEFTSFAKSLNIIGGIGFILAVFYFYFQYALSLNRSYYFLAAHCLLFGSAGILFEISYLWDAAWWWWHLLRITAYFVLVLFFIESSAIRNMQFSSTSLGKNHLIYFLAGIITATSLSIIFLAF